MLTAALERYLRHTVELTCAGRTDTGVHAWGQVVSFDAREDADPIALQRAVNRALRPTIVVRKATVAEPGFDARRAATGRLYRYQVRNDAVADPFSRLDLPWHVPAPLDLQRPCGSPATPCTVSNDFSSFCRRPPALPRASLVRMVRDARWLDLGDGMLRFDIEGVLVLPPQMVRSISSAPWSKWAWANAKPDKWWASWRPSPGPTRASRLPPTASASGKSGID